MREGEEGGLIEVRDDFGVANAALLEISMLKHEVRGFMCFVTSGKR